MNTWFYETVNKSPKTACHLLMKVVDELPEDSKLRHDVLEFFAPRGEITQEDINWAKMQLKYMFE